MSALERYNAAMEGELEGYPVERLRFFLSIALTGQDWIDVEQFIDGVSQQLANAVQMLSDQDFEYNRMTNYLIERHAQQLSTKDGEIARYKASPTVEACRQMIEAQAVKENEALHKQLAEREKQIVLLREALKDLFTATPNGICVSGYSDRYVTSKALAATDDLSGYILCYAEPQAVMKVECEE